MSKEVFLDIGAGFGERFIRRARENPDQKFLVVESSGPSLEPLPENLEWLVEAIEEENQLSIEDNFVDEVNLDFILSTLYADDKETLIPEALTESMRVLKEGGSFFIREPKYMLELLEPVLRKQNLDFSVEPIPKQEIEQQSLGVQEAYLEFKNGKVEMEPYLIRVKID